MVHRFPALYLLLLACGSLVLASAGCSRGHAESAAAGSTAGGSGLASEFPVEIRQPPVPQGVVTSTLDHHGQLVRLQCAACHSVRPANSSTALSSELDEFHQDLKTAHGKLTCVSCHQPNDGYSSLKLADGRSVAFQESMTLCAQCHGTQFRDYQHGSHGGMTGYWDLTQGGRTRNHCLHCHDPHAPQYPTFDPAAAPRDRFPPVVSGDSHE
jgi:hypothetical protein